MKLPNPVHRRLGMTGIGHCEARLRKGAGTARARRLVRKIVSTGKRDDRSARFTHSDSNASGANSSSRPRATPIRKSVSATSSSEWQSTAGSRANHQAYDRLVAKTQQGSLCLRAPSVQINGANVVEA